MNFLLRLISVLAVLSPFATAHASPKTVEAQYEITWQGFEVARISMGMSIEGNRYQLSFGAKTLGLVNVIFPFESEGLTVGRMTDSGPSPDEFSGIRRRADDGRPWRLTFDKDGNVLEREIDPADLVDRDPVPPELWYGPDPMSLSLMAILEAGPGVELSGRSFDGRRVLEASMVCDPDLRQFGDGSGEELRCELRGQLVAGASQRWREHGKDQPTDRHLNVWLSRNVIDNNWWPVRMEAETRFGTVSATLLNAP